MIKLKNLILEAFPPHIKNSIISKWKANGVNLTNDSDYDYYLDKFHDNIQKIQANNMPTDIKLYTFPDDQRDETKKRYTFTDLEHLVDSIASKEEYYAKRAKKDEDYTTDVIYNENGIVIWDADTREKCVKHGKRGNNYCIARIDTGNMFNRYRYMNRLTFYFILDEDKPDTDPFSFFSIGVQDNANPNDRNSKHYFVTDRNNSINTLHDWNFVSHNCEKLKNLQHLFKPKRLTDDQYKRFENINNIRTDAQYEALKLDDKIFYVQLGKSLSENMFKNSPPNIQKLYIETGHPNLEKIDHLFTPEQRKVLEKTLTQKGIEIAKRYGWNLNSNGRYDSNTDVVVPEHIIYKGKLIINFGVVNGFFSGRNLLSFDGFPTKVNDRIYIDSDLYTKLTPEQKKYVDKSNVIAAHKYMKLNQNIYKYNPTDDTYDSNTDIDTRGIHEKLTLRGKLLVKFRKINGNFNAYNLKYDYGLPIIVTGKYNISDELYEELPEHLIKAVDKNHMKSAISYAKNKWLYNSNTDSYDVFKQELNYIDFNTVAPNGKLLIKFGNVRGNFPAKKLTSFEGFPIKITGNIYISNTLYNKLSDVQQKFVDKSFDKTIKEYAKRNGWKYNSKTNSYDTPNSVLIDYIDGDTADAIAPNGKLLVRFGTINGSYKATSLQTIEHLPKQVNGMIILSKTAYEKLTPEQKEFVDTTNEKYKQ